ncbi:Crp/Fnr family transcriptional regulator [Runella sp. MFBS21]|uniref:Crp/Fnr family transcriptional regulator n=1 Tax=Runella sp. MFBS21 TaxID=3034018 RepID=UPI0023F889B1|nr:Crp/Fnr family transcriptional regulator [Runella sp. MFBS21]MDF7821294.1 Crp/Fnr family transcriptional regulator [Runella sp. MFBS21]
MPLAVALSKISFLSPQCQSAVRDVSHTLSYKAGRSLLIPGQVNEKLYFVKTGLIRAFYDTETHREVSIWFEQEGGWVLSVQSFLRQIPSYEYVELLEDSQLIAIQYEDLQRLLAQYPELNLPFRLIFENILISYDNHLQLFREKDALKRYQGFLELYPRLACRLQVKHVAQFLNLAPATLSRIRKKLYEAY